MVGLSSSGALARAGSLTLTRPHDARMKGRRSERVFRPERPERRVSEDVVAWRERCLVAAAFDAPIARELASDCDVDLHAVLELTDQGCPPALAARIAAPLERVAR